MLPAHPLRQNESIEASGHFSPKERVPVLEALHV